MHIQGMLLSGFACLGFTAVSEADVLSFVCAGKESIYTETFEEHQENLKHQFATLQIKVDQTKQTLSVSGTAKADGSGALRPKLTSSFDTSYPITMIIYAVPFKYAQVHLLKTKSELSIIATTHPDLALPDAEGRLLFSGTCKPTP